MSNKHDLQFEEFASDVLRGDDSDYVEVPIAPSMFVVVGVATLAIVGIMFARVVTLNVAQGSFYAARSVANGSLQKPIPAHRGIITDRFGTVIAKNTETFSVYINAAELLKNREQLTLVLSRLSEELNVSVEELESAMKAGNFEYQTEVPIVRNISSESAIAVRGLALPSVTVENDFRREYPNGAVFSSVVGYTGTSATSAAVVGKAGLEKYYDESLRGQDGMHIFHRDARGATLAEQIGVEAKAGTTLQTTIDGGLQDFFYRRLESGLRSLGIRSGVGLAMNPKTGEILSLVSLPAYNNNIFMTPGTSKERVALINDPQKPLFNRAIGGAYNPGSTIKPLHALAVLREKVVEPTYQIYSPGYIEIPNPYVPEKPSRFVDWRPQGWVDVRSAIARSSNVYFYEVVGGFPSNGWPASGAGLKGLGIDRLRQYWEKFGFGKKTGIDADNEAIGFLPSSDEKLERTRQPWRLGDTYNVAIGQGDLLVSPIQLISYIASVANDGRMQRPHLVRMIGDSGIIKSETVFDYSDWKDELKEVQLGMRDGVIKDYGTSHALNTLAMSVAAKTGSAQTNNNTKTNAFFVGYAPFEDPEIAIVVLIENAKEGSLNAVPIAKDVLHWYNENRIAVAPPPEP